MNLQADDSAGCDVFVFLFVVNSLESIDPDSNMRSLAPDDKVDPTVTFDGLAKLFLISFGEKFSPPRLIVQRTPDRMIFAGDANVCLIPDDFVMIRDSLRPELNPRILSFAFQ